MTSEVGGKRGVVVLDIENPLDEEVLATLRADASLPFSDEVRERVLANGVRVPSRRCGQLVLLAGGGPALRYCNSVLAVLAFAVALDRIDPRLVDECMLCVTVAGEYFVMNKDGTIFM